MKGTARLGVLAVVILAAWYFLKGKPAVAVPVEPPFAPPVVPPFAPPVVPPLPPPLLAPARLTIAVRPGTGGTVIIVPDKASYSIGDIMVLSAIPAPAWTFLYWEQDGEWLDSYPDLHYMVYKTATLTAVFLRPPSWG